MEPARFFQAQLAPRSFRQMLRNSADTLEEVPALLAPWLRGSRWHTPQKVVCTDPHRQEPLGVSIDSETTVHGERVPSGLEVPCPFGVALQKRIVVFHAFHRLQEFILSVV